MKKTEKIILEKKFVVVVVSCVNEQKFNNSNTNLIRLF